MGTLFNYSKAIVIGLVIGPIITYAFGIIRFGLGIVSIEDITTYATTLLGIGAVVGVLIGVTAAANHFSRARSAIVSAIVLFFLWASFFLAQAHYGAVPAGVVPDLVKEVFIQSLSGVLIAYLITLIAPGWKQREGQMKRPKMLPESRSSDRRYDL